MYMQQLYLIIFNLKKQTNNKAINGVLVKIAYISTGGKMREEKIM